ncbi:MAG: hypothetical protein ABSG21_11605 [Spirochaetia bacterium]
MTNPTPAETFAADVATGDQHEHRVDLVAVRLGPPARKGAHHPSVAGTEIGCFFSRAHLRKPGHGLGFDPAARVIDGSASYWKEHEEEEVEGDGDEPGGDTCGHEGRYYQCNAFAKSLRIDAECRRVYHR